MVSRHLRTIVRGPLRTQVRAVQARLRFPGQTAVVGPPDFVGIGVQRSGTSYWHALIEQHPSVEPLGLGAKELHYFDDLWSTDEKDLRGKSYFQHFRRKPGQICGEWTPRYMFDPWAVPALMRLAPSTRLLVLLRDPVTRFRSGVAHAVSRGQDLDADAVSEAFLRGLYGGQLKGVLQVAPREQILVLQFEKCLADPRHELSRTFDFLGLDDINVETTHTKNVAMASPRLPASLVGELTERYRDDVELLARIAPDDIDLSLWPRFVSP